MTETNRLLHPMRLSVTTDSECVPLFEFHILAEAREKYHFDETLYGFNGNVVFANFHAVRLFAKKMNDQRDLVQFPERAVKAGQLNAMGLIDEINHFMMRMYEEHHNPGVFARAFAHLNATVSEQEVGNALHAFCELVPPRDVYRKISNVKEYLTRSAAGKPHAEVTLEEMIMIWFANINPAFAPYHELFNDLQLRERSVYPEIIDRLQDYFRQETPFGQGGQSIFELLREPILASPHSLEGQLAYIRKYWGVHLSALFRDKLSGAGDLFREESKLVFSGGTPETVVPDYSRHRYEQDVDQERFTDDLEWMPNVILLAKNTYVWLDQLSKQYQRPITKLNEIPDEELDRIARWNITGLWLIGIWERSHASQTMKQMMGNPEAVASAYSVFDYEIASDLGGEEAFQNLRHRAWHRGIRLAGDMVPNHVGIYSKWIIEHPEYFVQTAYSPFPNYQFSGHDFSQHPGIELRIEEGYWSRSDAAVVFQRRETLNGSVRYIYHGNDGTSFPWNDTAQLNFLLPEVREAVIQEIFRVARKFSIIRFDAAMVLAKKHFQRLWYPEPGSGGDIPSRADHAMSRDEFDRVFPVEFWREVVDRINRDMPNTLLLAEAFWLLEGYFVRTLGMHRVYNSAFMHMMMKEENAKYRQLIYNTLSYNPEILKRYVNFMSNPDERTAVDQFGKDDKYFGVAMLLATLPGLPMFAHGQMEGYTEKYGMEYQRAYYNETTDSNLIARHEREIFPLLRKRYLFSQVAQFELYDFHGADGQLNENVFVYSNSIGTERALVCYNNRYEVSDGKVGRSVLKVRSTGEESKGLSVGDSLGLKGDEKIFYILQEHRSGLQYLRRGSELCGGGLHLVLQGFEYQLFLDFREIYDRSGEYAALAAQLHGHGVQSVEGALREMQLGPIHEALKNLMSAQHAEAMKTFFFASKVTQLEERKFTGEFEKDYLGLLSKIQLFTNTRGDVKATTRSFKSDLTHMRSVLQQSTRERFPLSLPPGINKDKLSMMLLGLLISIHVEEFMSSTDDSEENYYEAFRLQKPIDDALSSVEPDVSLRRRLGDLVKLLTINRSAMSDIMKNRIISGFGAILNNPDVTSYLLVHDFEGILYYNREAFDEVIEWMGLIALVRSRHEETLTDAQEMTIFKSVKEIITRLKNLSTSSEYRFETLQLRLEKNVQTAK